MSKEHVKALQVARALIRTGEKVFICYALPPCKASDEIKSQIMADLGEYETLFIWLNRTNIEASRVFDPLTTTQINSEHLLPTRLAWIDAMIEYWKDKP